jgi:hypothetical protein
LSCYGESPLHGIATLNPTRIIRPGLKDRVISPKSGFTVTGIVVTPLTGSRDTTPEGST